MHALLSTTNDKEGSVATCLRCGGLFSDHFIRIYCWVCWWNNFKNLWTFGEVTRKKWL